MPTLSDPVCLAHLVATAGMAGVLWTVQLAVYPLFAAVGRAEFPDYHRRYTARISAVVVPLMCLEAGTAAWLVFTGLRTGGFLAALGLLGLAWLSTFAVQVPLHRWLATGFDGGAHRRLVRGNWVRTAAWSARTGLLAWLTL